MQNFIIKHFSSLVDVDFNVFDVKLKGFENFKNTYCSKCDKACDYKNTHLYGCYESVRWDDKYIYYCPKDFIFIAVPVFDEDNILSEGIVIGPILMGEISDFEKEYDLPRLETSKVNDLAEIASIVFSGNDRTERKEKVGDFLNAIYKELELLPKCERYPIDLEKKLHDAIIAGDAVNARDYLNRLLGEVFLRSNGDINVIKSRALELIVLLSRSTIDGGADVDQIFALNNDYIQEINKFDTSEKIAVWLSSIINRFISYVFEFGDIKHSVTLRKIIGYIRNNYMRKITLDEISEHVYMSKSHLSTIFNEEMNMSITSYINKIRIEKSKRLLYDASLTIADIANLTGFEDQSYFTKQFKAETGLSPKKFRENIGVII